MVMVVIQEELPMYYRDVKCDILSRHWMEGRYTQVHMRVRCDTLWAMGNDVMMRLPHSHSALVVGSAL